MRGFKKFLFRTKWHVFPFFLKKRVLNFKRPKWSSIKSRINFSEKQYKFFKKKRGSIKLCKFIKNIIFLYKNVKKKNFYKKKLIKFIKYLKFYFFKKKYRILKRSLKYRLQTLFNQPYYRKYNYFSRFFNIFFFNYKYIRVSSKFAIRSRFIFKNILFMKSIINHYFHGCISLKIFKKQILINFYKRDLINIFIKFEYRLDLFLWRLKFFKSPHLARFAFQKNLVTINTFNLLKPKFSSSEYKKILKMGDICYFRELFFYNYNKNKNSYVKFLYLPSIFEVDYYTNFILIIKDLNQLNFKDINSLLKEPLCFYKFRNYISK